jgi:hypothetical protein
MKASYKIPLRRNDQNRFSLEIYQFIISDKEDKKPSIAMSRTDKEIVPVFKPAFVGKEILMGRKCQL